MAANAHRIEETILFLPGKLQYLRDSLDIRFLWSNVSSPKTVNTKSLTLEALEKVWKLPYRKGMRDIMIF